MTELEYKLKMKQLCLEYYNALITDNKKNIKEIQDKINFLYCIWLANKKEN